MTHIISLFNNKGGVSKTTTTFHLGWILAELGKKVLIVDADPQCNLSGVCLSTSRDVRLEELYNSEITNIKKALSPVFENTLKPIEPANCLKIHDNLELYLLPGHIEFALYDASFSIAENLTGSLTIMQNIPGAIRHLLEITAAKYSFDFILIDMSPSISATNANILMQSDYFMIPCAPDYFCYMAIKSLTTVLPTWSKTYAALKQNDAFKNATYKMKQAQPRFIGTIQQRYRPRNGSPARAFSEWIQNINELVAGQFTTALANCDLLLPAYDGKFYDEPYNIINIADFNSLIAQSQKHNTPVFSLTQEQVETGGNIWINMKRNIDDFHKAFELLANRVINITQ